MEDPGYGSGDAVDSSEQGRMNGRPELVFPLLSKVSLDATTTITTTDPGDPRTTVCAKGKFPGRLQRLEVFIGLEECLDTQRVQDTKSDEEDENILRSRCCLDALDGSPLKGFGVVQDQGAIDAKDSRVLRNCRRRCRRSSHYCAGSMEMLQLVCLLSRRFPWFPG